MAQIVSRRTLTGTVHVGFLVVKVAIRPILLIVLSFPLSVLFHQNYTLISSQYYRCQNLGARNLEAFKHRNVLFHVYYFAFRPDNFLHMNIIQCPS